MKYLLILSVLFTAIACQRNSDPLAKYGSKFDKDIKNTNKKTVFKSVFIPNYSRSLNFYLNEKVTRIFNFDVNMKDIKYKSELLEKPKGLSLKNVNGIWQITWKPSLKSLNIKKDSFAEEVQIITYVKMIAEEDETEANKLLIKKIDKLPVYLNVIDRVDYIKKKKD